MNNSEKRITIRTDIIDNAFWVKKYLEEALRHGKKNKFSKTESLQEILADATKLFSAFSSNFSNIPISHAYNFHYLQIKRRLNKLFISSEQELKEKKFKYILTSLNYVVYNLRIIGLFFKGSRPFKSQTKDIVKLKMDLNDEIDRNIIMFINDQKPKKTNSMDKLLRKVSFLHQLLREEHIYAKVTLVNVPPLEKCQTDILKHSRNVQNLITRNIKLNKYECDKRILSKMLQNILNFFVDYRFLFNYCTEEEQLRRLEKNEARNSEDIFLQRILSDARELENTELSEQIIYETNLIKWQLHFIIKFKEALY